MQPTTAMQSKHTKQHKRSRSQSLCSGAKKIVKAQQKNMPLAQLEPQNTPNLTATPRSPQNLGTFKKAKLA
jgi:hypothetical protein